MKALGSYRSARRLAAACAGLAMLPACTTVGPDFAAPAVEAPESWAAWHSGPDSLAAAPQAATRARAGWSAFGDAVLADLVARALQAGPDLQTAALHLAQARLQQAVVDAQAAPRVDARAAATRQRLSERGSATRLVDAIGGTLGAAGAGNAAHDRLIGILSEPFSLYQAGFDAAWEIDLWGRVRRLAEGAQADADAAGAMLRQVRLALGADVARAYFQLRAAQRQQRLVQADLALAEDALALARASRRGGLVDESEPLRQQAQLAQARARLPGLLARQAQAASRLTQLCGARPGALQAELARDGTVSDEAALPDLSLGLPAELVRRRPDIAAAEARLHAATADIGIAVADLYPRLTLGAGIGLESLSAGRLGDWGSRQWSVGPALSIPVFDRGRRRATVTLRKLRQQEAAVAYQQTVLRAWHEVDDAISGYAAEAQRRAHLLERVRRERALVDVAQARRARGLIDDLPRLQAERALLQAQGDLADGTARLQTALVAVYKALGDDGAEPLAGRTPAVEIDRTGPAVEADRAVSTVEAAGSAETGRIDAR